MELEPQNTDLKPEPEVNVLLAALLRAIAVLGTQSSLAKAIGASPKTVNSWVKRNKRIPLEWVGLVAKATKIPPAELRPDKKLRF